jgi:hypothetical protein
MSLGVRCASRGRLPAVAQQNEKLFVTGIDNWQTMFFLRGQVVADYGRTAPSTRVYVNRRWPGTQ